MVDGDRTACELQVKQRWSKSGGLGEGYIPGIVAERCRSLGSQIVLRTGGRVHKLRVKPTGASTHHNLEGRGPPTSAPSTFSLGALDEVRRGVVRMQMRRISGCFRGSG